MDSQSGLAEASRPSGDLAHAQECEQRYLRTGDRTALDAAVEAWSRILDSAELSQSDERFQLAVWNHSGRSYLRRYWASGRLPDLDRALDLWQQAVVRTPPEPPGLPRNLNNLGNGLTSRYARTGRLEDLEEGRSTFRRAIDLGMEASVESALVSARTWANWAMERQAWDEAYQVHATLFVLMDRLQLDQLHRSAKESWLRETQGVAARAAYAAAKVGQFESAVTALETGRARLLTEALEQDRRELELLPDLGQADLLARYRATVDEIRQLQLSPRNSAESTKPEFETAEAKTRHQRLIEARRQLDDTIAAIRLVPGFDDFLVTPTWTHIAQSIAARATVVYLVTVDAGSLALIVRRAQGADSAESQSSPNVTVSPLWLDDFRASDLDDLLIERTGDEVSGGYLPGQLGDHASLLKCLDGVLDTLGEKLMGRLAVALRSTNDSLVPTAPFVNGSSESADLPTITLVPVGRLALLPLHAARYVHQDRPTSFLDEFNVHYAISALSVGKARAESRSRRTTRCQLVGVGNPQPDAIRDPQRTIDSLRFAKAELRSIADFWPAADRHALYERDATGDALTTALPGASVVHLYCHGYFRPGEPLDSGGVLADCDVTLRELLDSGRQTLGQCRLAVLSACQTAIQDFSKLPDEAIGVPGVLAQAGVPTVVGTVWPVNDASTALLMVRFYELAFDKDRPQPPHVALRNAQLWLRTLTNQRLVAYLNDQLKIVLQAKNPSRMPPAAINELLFPFDGLEKDHPHDRPFSSTYYWAPFVAYGAEEFLSY